MLKLLLAAATMVAAVFASAQVKIVDSMPMGANVTEVSAAQADATANFAASQAELYYQLQMLQQEVLELRGLVEQQTHELRRVKQQRLDDYVDLDRRIGQLSTSPDTTVAPTPSRTPPRTEESASAVPSAADELASYRTALDFVLKERKFDEGIQALRAYLDDFPAGRYAGNAQYWLGQIYLQKEELQESKTWFSQMISDFPTHQKTEEAKYKLATVYNKQGDKAKAKALLEEVIASDSPASDLAQDYLDRFF